MGSARPGAIATLLDIAMVALAAEALPELVADSLRALAHATVLRDS